MPPKVIKIFETLGDDFFLISFLAIDTQKYGPIFLTWMSKEKRELMNKLQCT